MLSWNLFLHITALYTIFIHKITILNKFLNLIVKSGFVFFRHFIIFYLLLITELIPFCR